ncbi:MAG: patatin family protein [Solobacterium sp.]|nr:patatin family protein [Solobacterium sp.]
METYGLVLEGGGVRGAYTAGALHWCYDHHISFDYSVGISSGAVYQACFEAGDMDAMEHMALVYACEKENVGIRAILKEGHYVAYQRLFHEDMIERQHFSVKELRESGKHMEIGCYDLEQGKTVFYGSEYLDDNMDLLRGACALPVASAIVNFNGHPVLDGGITKMIPIERALEQGCTKTLVITTKPKDFVRKPASPIVRFLMKILYAKYPSVEADYKVRHLNYYKQMDLINEKIDEGNAIMIYPTQTISVSRWKGDPEKCKELYDLGYSDMEARKEELYQFLGVSPSPVDVLLQKEKVPA